MFRFLLGEFGGKLQVVRGEAFWCERGDLNPHVHTDNRF